MRHSFRRGRWTVGLLALVVGLGLYAAGCGDTQRMQTYRNDGQLGTTFANPNIVGSPGYHTYRQDLRLIKETLADIRGIRRSAVFHNGGNVTVRLTLDSDLSVQEKEAIRAEALERLTGQLPRYRINVRIA